MIKTRFLSKKFQEISKKIVSIRLYFDFLKEHHNNIENIMSVYNNSCEGLSYQDLDQIFDLIDKFINFLNKEKNNNSREITESEIKDLKILIGIKIIKKFASVKLTFENLLREKDITNYEAFICALSFNDTVEEIKLSNYLWDNEGSFSFFKNFDFLFKYNKRLRKIMIEGNILKENDLKFIKISLSNNRSLEELLINCSGYLKNTGMRKVYDEFKNTANIKKLSIIVSMYTDCLNERVHFFSEMVLENSILKKLVTYRNRVDVFMSNMYEILDENLKIEELRFRFELIPDDVFENIIHILMKNTNIVELDISHNNLSDKSLAELCEYLKLNRKLRILNLEKNNIGDEGLRILSEILLLNDEIKELDISWNNFTDEGIKHFKNFIANSKSIEKIFLSKERLSEEGIKEIKEAFKKNMNIKKIMMGIVNMTR